MCLPWPRTGRRPRRRWEVALREGEERVAAAAFDVDEEPGARRDAVAVDEPWLNATTLPSSA